ncbi:uncharacterized protein LOC134468305 [Engraulis encrasicolus]|uniref:uncharacterized protein LOC134468305 n=1 Tax=Engraulis encrasicolus TaxID=184585 RepID=UPI002FD62278
MLHGAIEEVRFGKVQNSESNRAERLGVDSACGLVINDVTAEDAGRYTCRQFTKTGEQRGKDGPVNLAVLQVSASPSVSHIEAGGEVSLQCRLYTHDKCKGTVKSKGLPLSWVDNNGQELLSSGNREMKEESQCHISMTEQLTDLKPSEKQRTWTCRVTADGRVEASANFTLPVKASESISTPTPSSTPDRTGSKWTSTPSPRSPPDDTGQQTDSSPGSPNYMVPVIVAAVGSCCLLATVVIVVICRRRAMAQ